MNILRNKISFSNIFIFSILVFLAVISGILVSKAELLGAFGLIAFSGAILYFYFFCKNPIIGIYSMIVMGFLIPFFNRYFPVAPFGLSIDSLLVLTIVIYFIKEWRNFSLKPLKNSLTLAFFIWFLFVVMMLGNPLVRSYIAWFYAMRGLALYSFLIVPLGFLIFNDRKNFERLFLLVVLFEIIGSLWGIKQLFIGVSAAEQRWLDAGAADTHILFGKLRVFSYFTDAAQFGSSQAHIGLVSLVFAIADKIKWRKWYYFIGAILCFYGMLISGSRAPIIIPAAGGLIVLIMSKKWKLLIIGLTIGIGAFVFLKYTTILQSNYQINRLRTALDPKDDPSFMVRKNREMAVAKYLKGKLLGEGIGSAGFWVGGFYRVHFWRR